MKALVDGVAQDWVAINDRGLAYGDGVFETIRIKDGALRLWSRHLERLKHGLECLQITFEAFDCLRVEAETLAGASTEGVLKIIVTRGASGRGYGVERGGKATRILTLCPPTRIPQAAYEEGISVIWCNTRLGINPRLAGIKHLNRLEQVLAKAEWSDAKISEGLMRDMDGRVVEATSSNLFLDIGGKLVTPLLDRCGVAGVMRGLVMELAKNENTDVIEKELYPEDMITADGIFVTNAISGIRPVRCLLDREGPKTEFSVTSLTRELMQAVQTTQ